MRIAVLGLDEISLPLVRQAVAAGHQLVVAYGADSYQSQLQRIAPDVQLRSDWESMLIGSLVDGVIVGSLERGFQADELRADQLRKLTQAAVPMLVVHPACEPMLGFEIEMIRRDLGAVILPYWPEAMHPAVATLASWQQLGEESPIGTIEQVIFQRPMVDRGRDAVLRQFTRDLSILRQVLLGIRAINATGPTAKHRDPYLSGPKVLPPLANLHVHVTGEVAFPARWSVEIPTSDEPPQLTVVGTRGKSLLAMPADHAAWRLEVIGPMGQVVELPPTNIVRMAIDEFAKLATQPASSQAEQGIEQSVTWLSSIRDVEAAAAVDRSIERARTIELLNEEISEEESFKGVMAVGGCLLLMVAFGALLLATIVEGLQLPLRNWAVWRYWPVYLLAPIVVFLLLQLLQLVIKREQPKLTDLIDPKK